MLKFLLSSADAAPVLYLARVVPIKRGTKALCLSTFRPFNGGERKLLASGRGILCGFLTFSLGIPTLRASQVAWLAFGDLRGNLESCGCDPRTDLGGVKRLATFVTRERGAHPSLILLDLGNNHSHDDGHKIQDRYISAAIKRLAPTASLMNWADLEKSVDRSHPVVLSNASPRLLSKQPTIANSISYYGGAIFGYTWREGVSLVTRFSPAMETAWRKSVKKVPGFNILLFSGPATHLREIVRAKIFDAIISSNASPWGSPPGLKEKENLSLLERRFGKLIVLMVPLGGTGVLRGGVLLGSRVPSIAEIFEAGGQNASISRTFSESLVDSVVSRTSEIHRHGQPSPSFVTWLDQSYDSGSPFEDLMSKYQRDAADAYQARAAKRKLELAKSPFVGAQACRACHVAQYAAWSASSHARALGTLKISNRDKVAKCVTCHVLGYNVKGGFVSEEVTPHFAGVQCENCHGPRRSHIANPAKKSEKAIARAACVRCHHTPHSPAFVWQEYWQKIAH